MSYEEVVSDVVKVVEAFGGGIMVLGGVLSLGRCLQQTTAQLLTHTRGSARTSGERSCSR
jgi:hypothetical protein